MDFSPLQQTLDQPRLRTIPNLIRYTAMDSKTIQRSLTRLISANLFDPCHEEKKKKTITHLYCLSWVIHIFSPGPIVDAFLSGQQS